MACDAYSIVGGRISFISDLFHNLLIHLFAIVRPAGVAAILLASMPVLSAGLRRLVLRPLKAQESYTPMLILEAWSISLWIVAWLGTTTWLHIVERRQRIDQIMYVRR
jgi:hypothetical protein